MRNICIIAVLVVTFVTGIYIGNISSMRSQNFTAFKSGEQISFFVDREAPRWAEEEISNAIMNYSIRK